MMKKSMVLLSALLVVGCQSHQSTANKQPSSVAKQSEPSVDEPSIKDVKLGDTPESFKQKFPNAMCFNDKVTSEINACLANDVTYATVPGMLAVQFQGGKADLISVRNLTPSDFSTVSAALVQRMGPSNDGVSKLFKAPPGSVAWEGSKWIFIASPAGFDGNAGVLLVDKAYVANTLNKKAKKEAADL